MPPDCLIKCAIVGGQVTTLSDRIDSKNSRPKRVGHVQIGWVEPAFKCRRSIAGVQFTGVQFTGVQGAGVQGAAGAGAPGVSGFSLIGAYLIAQP